MNNFHIFNYRWIAWFVSLFPFQMQIVPLNSIVVFSVAISQRYYTHEFSWFEIMISVESVLKNMLSLERVIRKWKEPRLHAGRIKTIRCRYQYWCLGCNRNSCYNSSGMLVITKRAWFLSFGILNWCLVFLHDDYLSIWATSINENASLLHLPRIIYILIVIFLIINFDNDPPAQFLHFTRRSYVIACTSTRRGQQIQGVRTLK